MSSDSATTASSRLRQFGLYRTIDARTEEFLKLSRRRQIRQGCACAAVSTAITVTVVVSVLLVYEYGFHADSELSQSHHPHWLGMLNDSDASFDKNIQKTNFNINRNTLKLLPILLKALKQNRYLEKVIVDYSSQTPTQPETTDYPLERNIFTDARNWVRTPSSRLYAIEYKSSPIVFFKTRNIDNFAKTTKMMNSQRIMSYFDRMINEKVGYGPISQMISYDPLKTTSPNPAHQKIPSINSVSKDRHQRQKTTHVKTNEKTRSIEIDKAYCKCPNNLGEILKKLLISIQRLLPENKKADLGEFLCGGSKLKMAPKQSKTLSTTTRTITTKAIPEITTKTTCGTMKGDVPSNCHTQTKMTIDKESILKSRSKPRNTNSIQNMISNMKKQKKIPRKDLTNAIISRNYQNLNLKDSSHSFEDITTMKAQIAPTEDNNIKYSTTTKPMTVFPRRKMHSKVKDLERFTLKHHENYQDFGDDHLTTKTDKVSDYEEDTLKMRKTTADILSEFITHIEPLKEMGFIKVTNDTPAISKSKNDLLVDPFKRFRLERQGNKPKLDHQSVSPVSTTNSFKLHNYNAKDKRIRKKISLSNSFGNITEYIKPTQNVNFKNITTHEPITDVSEVKTHPKVENLESFLLEHQGNEQDFGDKDFSDTASHKFYDYEAEKTKIKKTNALNIFLHKLEETQKNNKNFAENFNEKQEPIQESNSHTTSDKTIILEDMNNLNGTHVLETLTDFDQFGAISANKTFGSNPGSLAKRFDGYTEFLNSMIPQSRPPFLEIRRNDGRREDRDYDEDTNTNNFTYD